MAAARSSRPVRILLAGTLVSFFGTGLTYPLLLVYLHGLRHIPLAETGLLLAAAPLAGLAAGPLAGAASDAIGPKPLLVGGLVCCAGASVGLIATRGPLVALVVLAAFGAGDSAATGAVSTLLGQVLTDEAARLRVFSIEFTLVNLGIGGGALLAGSLVSLARPASFTLVYALDATTYLLPALAIALTGFPGAAGRRARARHPARHATRRPTAPGYRVALADPALRRYAIVVACLSGIGYASLDAGFVGFSTTVVKVSPRVIAYAFTVNTATIVTFQHLATRLVSRRPRSVALAATAGCFGVAWLIEGLAARFPDSSTGAALVLGFGAVFACAEMLYAPVRGVIVNALAPDALRGRYNAVVGFSYQGASVAAPPIAGALLGAGLAGVWIAGLLGASGATALVARNLRRHLSPAQDNRARVGGAEPA